jgi:hypothetical protein
MGLGHSLDRAGIITCAIQSTQFRFYFKAFLHDVIAHDTRKRRLIAYLGVLYYI